MPWVHGIQWTSSTDFELDGKRKFSPVSHKKRQCGPVGNGARLCISNGNRADLPTKAKGIARGLGHLHGNGIVHADLKGVSIVYCQRSGADGYK